MIDDVVREQCDHEQNQCARKHRHKDESRARRGLNSDQSRRSARRMRGVRHVHDQQCDSDAERGRERCRTEQRDDDDRDERREEMAADEISRLG